MTSCLLTRTLPPILKKEMSRFCCKRRTLDSEIFNSSAASTSVISSPSGSESIDIVVKEQCSVSAISGRQALQRYHCSALRAMRFNDNWLRAASWQYHDHERRLLAAARVERRVCTPSRHNFMPMRRDFRDNDKTKHRQQ